MSLLPEYINKKLEQLNLETHPKSIFLYGSRARKDFVEDSDYEIGVLYSSNNKIPRHQLVKKYSVKDVRLYPFDYEEFINNQLDTPFPKVIYMRTLLESAKTIFGENVLENMNLPTISLIDLLEEATFQISRAYTAMLSEREGDVVNAKAGLVKSTLFGARTLVVLRKKVFPVEYDKIAEFADKLKLDSDYVKLIKHGLAVRMGKDLSADMLFKNISFLNRVVIKEIKEGLIDGNKIII